MATPTFTNLIPSGGNEGLGLNSVILATKVLNGTAVLDPANLADGIGVNLSITVTGAVVGDFVLVAPGSVISANTVEVRLQNETTGAINLASSTWKAKVIQDGI